MHLVYGAQVAANIHLATQGRSLLLAEAARGLKDSLPGTFKMPLFSSDEPQAKKTKMQADKTQLTTASGGDATVRPSAILSQVQSK
jgi:hypothetical protein